METVYAEHHHRVGLRQLAGPFLHEVRVAPGRTLHDVLLPRHGVPRASVDDLHRLAGLEHLLHFLYAHAGQVAELLLHQRPRRGDLARVLVPALDRLPVDVLYERVDVCPRVRAKFDVVRVLVHIEREDGNAARDGRRVLGRILVDQPSVARDVDEQHPPGAAGKRGAHGAELLKPALERAEVAHQRLGERPGRPGDIAAFGDRGYAQAREIQLVQQRGIERDHFFALQAVDHVTRRLREIERLQLLRDGV